MQKIISNNANERLLTDDTLGDLAEEIISNLREFGSDRVVVHLANNDLTLAYLQTLVDLLRKSGNLPAILALDVSLNRIQASWEETNKIVAALLGDTHTSQRLVGFLNLSLNYLPALETLNEDQHLKQMLYSYGRRLSLGFDHDLMLGVPGVDYWTLNARVFKHIAYGQNL